jgi:hypothetical protein
VRKLSRTCHLNMCETTGYAGVNNKGIAKEALQKS